MSVAPRPAKFAPLPEPDDSWIVYILRCADRSLYTGVTTDLVRRTEQHNAGIGARYTRGRLPVRVVYQETHSSRSLALKREIAIKSMGRRKKEALIGESKSPEYKGRRELLISTLPAR